MFRTENRWMNVLSWLHGVLLFSGFYLVAAAIFGLRGRDAAAVWLNSLWLFFPIITSWIFIRKIKSFPVYLLGAAVVVAVTAILSYNILTFVFSIVIFMIRAYVRIIQGRMNDPDLPGQVKEVELWEIPTLLDKPEVVHWAVFVVLYITIIFLEQNHLLKWMFLLLFLEVFVTYIFRSLNQMKKYVVENCHIAHLPVKVMQKMQRAVLGITLVLLTVFVLPSVFYGKEPLTALADLSLNLEMNIEEETMQAMPAMPDPAEAMQEMFGIEEKEPNVILEKILEIISYIVMGIAGAGMVYAVWHICRKMMNSFESGQEMDEVIMLEEGEDSFVTKIRRNRKSIGQQSSRNKIRKTYKKIIKKSMKESPAGWETPEELEEKAGLQDEAVKKLHEVYEKARYSGDECGEAELAVCMEFGRDKRKR